MRSPGRFVSLVIAEDQIDFVECNNKKSKLEIISFGSYPCKLGDYEDMERVLKSISNSIKKHKYTYITLITSDFLKHIHFIKGGSADPKNVILQEFKNIYEISLNEYYIDYSYENIENGLLTFCCGIRKSIIEPVLDILVKYDFKLLSLAPGIASIVNGITHVMKNLDCVYLNIFDERLVISLISDGNLFTFREVKHGIENIVEDLAEKGGILVEEAKELLYSKGLNDNGDDEIQLNIQRAISEAFDKVSMEIQKTIDYYFITFRRKRIDNFVLSYGFLKIPGIENYFKKLFGVNIHKINLQKVIKFSGIEEELFELKYLDVCISAALK